MSPNLEFIIKMFLWTYYAIEQRQIMHNEHLHKTKKLEFNNLIFWNEHNAEAIEIKHKKTSATTVT